MKTAFIDTLTSLMRRHQDIVTITADMGYSVFEPLQKEFPKRFFNTGVTEQSTMGLVAGMALSGYTVFVYAQAVFLALRCLEQVRLDVSYHRANVKIVGTAGGFWLNQLGASHFGLEDVGAMRLMPGMKILVPGDPYEAQWAIKKAYATPGPVYIRLAKPDRQFIHRKPLTTTIGDPILISGGKKAAILVSGTLLNEAIPAIKTVEQKTGIRPALYSVPTVKPIRDASFVKLLRHYATIFTLEEHSIVGGLGSAIAELIADRHIPGVTLTRLAVPDAFIHYTGSREYLLKRSGLSAGQVADRMIAAIHHTP